jgi:hypothetical protein
MNAAITPGIDKGNVTFQNVLIGWRRGRWNLE